MNEDGSSMLEPNHMMLSNKYCASGCLSREPDFMAQREWLREVVEDAGLAIIFYPKYHCELNYIELIWGHMKRSLRKSCTFNFKDLKENIAELLETMPNSLFQSCARFCYRFMSGYRLGLSGPIIEFTMKKFKRHRSIPDGVVNDMKQQYEEKVLSKRPRV